jgi:two-component system chemotaxis sensor kinase CheA
MFVQQKDISAEDFVTSCNARLDTLATRLMVQGGGPETIEELTAFRSDALEHNASQTVAALDSILSMMQKDIQQGTGYLLKTGLDELRRSLTASAEQPAAESPMSLSEDAELVSDFLVEAREHLSKIEGQMLELERDPTAMEVIHAVFRAFHTIKGLAGFLDFGSVQALSHEVETLLDLARNGALVVDSSVVDVVLESGDALKSELCAIERALNGGAPLEAGDHRALIEKIKICAAPKPPTAEVGEAAKPQEETVEVQVVEAPAAVESEAPNDQESAEAEETVDLESPETDAADEPQAEAQKEPEAAVDSQAAAPQERVVSSPVVAAPKSAAPPAVHASAVASKAAAKPAPAQAATPAPRQAEPARDGERRSSEAGSVRVETAKLDHLMDMVGEIVIAQSLIRHNQTLAATSDTRLLGDLSQLARVTAEVQRATMSMRMVPVGQLFQRIERAIRDLSRKAGKQVSLETSGTDTGIDKTVAEELADPLMHMVRNSVDHGIELPAERIAAGKSAEARIRLSARHQGGQVIIEISDDGRGLNSEKIRRKAEERQLIQPGALLTDAEINQLIFEPGFSTADKITDVSGRGVGMDVVRRNVEKMRGRIETLSTWGQGTTFLLKLPLTLAIIDGLVVEVGTERYIIPLSGVWEMFRPQPDALFTVEGRDEMTLVRGQLLPVVRLHQRLGIAGRSNNPAECLMVVVESNGRRFCLLVDDLLGKQEIVIKSLGHTFKDVPALSGCAVLGDGRVGLILDIDGLFRGRR